MVVGINQSDTLLLNHGRNSECVKLLTPCQDCFPVQLGHCMNIVLTDAQVDPKLMCAPDGVYLMMVI